MRREVWKISLLHPLGFDFFIIVVIATFSEALGIAVQERSSRKGVTGSDIATLRLVSTSPFDLWSQKTGRDYIYWLSPQ